MASVTRPRGPRAQSAEVLPQPPASREHSQTRTEPIPVRCSSRSKPIREQRQDSGAGTFEAEMVEVTKPAEKPRGLIIRKLSRTPSPAETELQETIGGDTTPTQSNFSRPRLSRKENFLDIVRTASASPPDESIIYPSPDHAPSPPSPDDLALSPDRSGSPVHHYTSLRDLPKPTWNTARETTAINPPRYDPTRDALNQWCSHRADDGRAMGLCAAGLRA
ncbi:hypothetical protein LTR53_017035 [Teratosphaeriaceae sp. CCFEE 6253]|nr:hypothetical protein LTR53_017035 [Teratosphaeriaceae sp. CCFEE 6253]